MIEVANHHNDTAYSRSEARSCFHSINVVVVLFAELDHTKIVPRLTAANMEEDLTTLYEPF